LYTMKAIDAMSFEESIRFTESQTALFALTEDAAEGSAHSAKSGRRTGPDADDAGAIDEEMEVNLSPQLRTVRIGGASGFWGDSSVGAPQLVASGQIDYLVFDYLAELTMSILAAARQKNAALGYATDFVTVAMRAVLKDIVQRGIRVVSNA